MPRRWRWWQTLSGSYWSLPTLIIVLFALTATAVVWVDERGTGRLTIFAFGGGAPAARSILTTIAGSYITVSGLTLSLTILVLQIVAGQLTPRAVRGLLDGRFNQVTAGSLFGIFAFCLLVLRAVRDETPTRQEFTAPLGVDCAVLLALAGLVLLLVFIHGVADSLQVSTICARIAQETLRAVDRAYPASAPEVDRGFDDVVRARSGGGAPTTVIASRSGFLREVHPRDHGDPRALLVIDIPVGRFVTVGTPLGRAWGGDARSAVARVGAAVVIDRQRALAADPAFGLRQLSDIGLRAVSPGVNDPTTALTSIGWLRVCLERLAARDLAPTSVGSLIVRWRSFTELVEEGLLEIGRYAVADAAVSPAILEALEGIALAATSTPARREAVRALAREVAEAARAAATFGRESDRLRTLTS